MTAAPNGTMLLKDITQCSICLETWRDPRSPPCCDHTFCLHCLKDLVETSDEQKVLICPICRIESTIPNGGLDRLPKNFIHQQLLDALKIAFLPPQQRIKEELVYSSTLLCELCQDESIATRHCVHCVQNMCSQCASLHLRASVARSHTIVLISQKEDPPVFRKQCISCSQHEYEKIKLYCEECQMPMCIICFLKEHTGHKCSVLNEAYKMFSDKIQACHGDVNEGISETKCHIEQLGNEMGEFLNIISIEYKSLQDTREKLKELIEAEHKQLLQNLSHIKEKCIKDMTAKMDELKRGVQVLQVFMKKSNELINEGSECDLCYSANDLLTEADALLQAQALVNQKMIHHCDVRFTAAKTPDVSGYKIQLIGMLSCSNTAYLDLELLPDQQGKLVNVNELFFKLETERDEFRNEANKSEKFAEDLLSKLAKLGSRNEQLENDLKTKEGDIANQNAEHQQMKRNVQDFGFDGMTNNFESTVIAQQIQFENQYLQTQLKKVSDESERILKKLDKNRTSFICHSSAVRVTPGKGGICGVAVVGSKVFVARDGMTCIEVHDSNNQTLMEKLEVSKSIIGLSNPRLAACSKHNCLYIGSSSDVRRFDLTCGATSKWQTVKGDCAGLSVTSNYNLLVTLRYLRKVQEHTTHGSLIREIILDQSIDYPQHCIQMSSGSFVVSTFSFLVTSPGALFGLIGRLEFGTVCIVGPNGKAEVLYGGSKEPGVIQLKRPYQLAVDKHDRVFVIDYDNDRIQVLDHTLTHIGNIQTPGIQIKEPYTIYLDEANHRLYIGEWTGRLITIEANIAC